MRQKRWKRVLAVILAAAIAAAGKGTGHTAKTEAAETVFSEENTPVTTLKMEFQNRFTRGQVFQNGRTLNTSKIALRNFYQQAEAEADIKDSEKISVKTTYPYIAATRLPKDKKKQPAVLYKKVGTYERNGELIDLDLQVTLTDWDVAAGTAADMAYAAFSVCAMEDGGHSIYSHDLEAIGVWLSANVRWVQLSYSFYEAGTAKKLSIDGGFTQVDLDYRQYFAFTEASGISYISRASDEGMVLNDGDRNGSEHHITIKNGTQPQSSLQWTKVCSSKAGTNPGNEATGGVDFVSGYYTDTSGSLCNRKIPGSYKGGYVTFHFRRTDTLIFRFGTDASPSTVNVPDGTKLNHYYFGILPYSVGAYEVPKPVKYVMKEDGTLSESAVLDTGGRDVTYVASVSVPRSITANYNAFSIKDCLHALYDPAGTTVEVRQDELDGQDVTGWFTKSVSGQTLTVSAGQAAIQENAGRSFFGHRYYMIIRTKIREGITEKDLKAYADKKRVEYTDSHYRIANTVSCTAGVYQPYANGGKGAYIKETTESDPVYVYFNLPSLSVQKTVNGEKTVTVQVGDTVHYAVSTAQTTTGAALKNVKISDTSLKNSEAVCIDPASVKAELQENGRTIASIIPGVSSLYGSVRVDSNCIYVDSFTFSPQNKEYTNRLYDKRSVLLTYDAVIQKETGTAGLSNRAVVTADDVEKKEDLATVIALKPALQLEKYVEKVSGAAGWSYAVGDTAAYKVVIFNASKATPATNLILQDGWKESMQISKTAEADGIEVYHTTDQKHYTETAYAKKLVCGRDYTLRDVKENGFAVVFQGAYADLEASEGYIITYQTKVTGMGDASHKIVNTAVASSTNAGEVTAKKTIRTVSGPDVEVTKQADQSEVPIGEEITYTVTVSNTGDDTLSPFVISDDTLPAGFLLKSLKVQWYRNTYADSKENMWETIFSGDYGIVIRKEERGWRILGASWSDGLSPGESIRVTAVYTTDRRVQTAAPITNTVTVSGTGYSSATAVKETASADVRVCKPVLSVTKTSDQTEYGSGDTGIYTLTVSQDENQTRKDMTAYQVIVNDVLDKAWYGTLDHREKIKSVVKVDKEGKRTDVTESCTFDHSYAISGNTLDAGAVAPGAAPSSAMQPKMFGINTRQDLAYGEQMVITYEVRFDPAYVDSGAAVTNQAVAEAVNADAVQTSYTVCTKEPRLVVEKNVEREHYGLGDAAVYTIRVTQTENAIAKNIVLTDMFDAETCTQLETEAQMYICHEAPEKSAMRTDSVKLYDSSGKLWTKYTLTAMREDGAGGYRLAAEGITLKKGESLTITYEVALEQEAFLGMVTNMAVVSADNTEPALDTATIQVEKPQLYIQKNAAQETYLKEETVVYTVDVANMTAGTTVYDLQTKDTVPSELKLNADSLEAVLVDEAGNEIEDESIQVTISQNTWQITKESLDAACALRIRFTAEATGAAVGKTLQNTATAYGKNAEAVQSMCEIRILPRHTAKITKKIPAAEINFANGDPVFVVSVSGKDCTGKPVSRNQVIRFTPEDVEAHTDEQGLAGVTVLFEDLWPGVYTVSEKEEAMRYRLRIPVSGEAYGISDGQQIFVAGITNEDGAEKITFDLSDCPCEMTASAVFINECYEQQYDSDTAVVKNWFGTGRKGE